MITKYPKGYITFYWERNHMYCQNFKIGANFRGLTYRKTRPTSYSIAIPSTIMNEEEVNTFLEWIRTEVRPCLAIKRLKQCL